MFKISKIIIDGFWGIKQINTTLYNDVNIVIGRNGTGKTTLINILQAILTVDLEWLYDYEFNHAELELTNDNEVKVIKIEKTINEEFGFPIINYLIEGETFTTRIISSDDNIPLHFRRRMYEESTVIRDALSNLVSITSLSVYRIKKDYLQDRRETNDRKIIAPVDFILLDLMQKLTTYQLELSNKSRTISSQLQKEVLTSLLLNDRDKTKGFDINNFDERTEKAKLISAYKRLGVDTRDVRNFINEHIDNVSKSITFIRDEITKGKNSFNDIDPAVFVPLENFRRTNDIVEKSLLAETEEKQTYKQRENFLSILKRFITDKVFSFENNGLKIDKNGDIPISKLSSGEKQLLILFTEALLQREVPGVFIADEPELSLHIGWQREILPAIRQLNPNCQLIVATHSPEVAGKYSDKILDMEDISK